MTPVGAPLLTVEDLMVTCSHQDGLFGKTQRLRAVDGIRPTLHQGETPGVAGEVRLRQVHAGAGGASSFSPKRQDGWYGLAATPDAATWSGLRSLREEFQIVFQDPLASLDPRMPIPATPSPSP